MLIVPEAILVNTAPNHNRNVLRRIRRFRFHTCFLFLRSCFHSTSNRLLHSSAASSYSSINFYRFRYSTFFDYFHWANYPLSFYEFYEHVFSNRFKPPRHILSLRLKPRNYLQSLLGFDHAITTRRT